MAGEGIAGGTISGNLMSAGTMAAAVYSVSEQRAASVRQAGASVESSQIAAQVARESIEFQREGLEVQREGIGVAREGVDIARGEAEFQRTQYEDWKDVFGDLQENIGGYYKALGPERIIAQGLQAEQVEFQKSKAALTKTLTQRGIGGSGVEAAALTTLEGARYTGRAGVRASAEQKVIEKKQGFLGLGLGQGAHLLGTLAATTGQTQDAYGNVASAYGGVGRAYGQVGGAYGQQVGAYGQQAQTQARFSGGYLRGAQQTQVQAGDFLSDVVGFRTGLRTGAR